MNLRDLINRLTARPEKQEPIPQISYRARGVTGIDNTGGYYNEEYFLTLRGPDAADVFDKMRRNDPQIRMLLSAFKNPILAAEWFVEPVDESDEEFEIANFIDYVLFRDIGYGDNRKTWRELLSEILSYAEFGFSVFEVINKIVTQDNKWGSYVGLKDVAFRSQKTIERWNLARDGALESVYQQAYGDNAVNVNIPGKDLVIFTANKEGNNYEGISFLRPVYGNWFRIQQYQKLQGIGIERGATGVPLIELAEGVSMDSADAAALQDVLSEYRLHQKAGVIMPFNYKFNQLKIEHDARAIQDVIAQEYVQVAKSFMAPFMELGTGGQGGGSYALSNDLSDFYLTGIQYHADYIADVITQNIIRKLVDINFGKRDAYPQLRATRIIDKGGKELAEILEKLMTVGLIENTDRLRAWVSKQFDMPELLQEQDNETSDVESGIVDAPSGQDDGPPDDTPPPGGASLPTEPNSLSEPQCCTHHLGDNQSINTPRRMPPKKAQLNALKALELNKEWKRSVNLISEARAKEISEGNLLSDHTVRRIAQFGSNNGEYRPELKADDGGPTDQSIEWLLYGGQEGIDWARAELQEIDSIALAESPSQVIKGIDEGAAELEIIMKGFLKESSDKLIERMKKVFETESGVNQIRGVTDLTMTGIAKYEKLLASYLPQEAQDAVDQVLAELNRKSFKFADDPYKDLPKSIKEKVRNIVKWVALDHFTRLSNQIKFSYNQNVDNTDSGNLMASYMKKAQEEFLESATLRVGAVTIESSVVNGARFSVYNDEDIFEDIESFIFTNPSPISAICKSLTGKVFTKEEYLNTPYLPPLHHNCKSIIVAQTAGEKGNKQLSPGGLRPTGTEDQVASAIKSIKFKEEE